MTRKREAARAAGPDRRPASHPLGTPAEVALETVLYDKPGYLARRMQQIGVSIFLQESGELDITPLQYGVMAVVRAFPGIDQAGVSKTIGLDRTTVVGIVDRLERKELLVRQHAPEDRRLWRLYLTDLGGSQMAELRPRIDRAQERMLEPLTEAERDFFVHCLMRVVSHHNAGSRTPVTVRGVAAPGGAQRRTGPRRKAT
jgi:DNA-binding MarR family transcriptional regulator